MDLLFAALVLILATSAASADTLAGRASVIDADTINIHGERIRILDIDAPEGCQTCTKDDGTECRCGRVVQLTSYRPVGRNGITSTTRAWSLANSSGA